MPYTSTPICFRMTEDERLRIEAAAAYVGETLSNFVRVATVIAADRVLADAAGVDVIEQYREVRERAARFRGSGVAHDGMMP